MAKKREEMLITLQVEKGTLLDSLEKVIFAMDEKEILKFLISIDYNMQDFGFTEKLVKALATALWNEGAEGEESLRAIMKPLIGGAA